MNRRRALKLILLAGLAVAASFAIVQGIERIQPDHVWKSAQKALAVGNTAEAKIYLQNIVQTQPEHGEAHLALAKLLVVEAEAAGQPATYADLPAAARHLMAAARFLPKNIELQRQALQLHLAAGRIDDGYEVAQRIQLKDPHDPDMMTAHVRHAVQAYLDAVKDIDRLLERSPGYRARLARAEIDAATGNRAHFQQTIDVATTRAMAATADELAALPKTEFDALASLILAGVPQADDASSSAARIDEGLRVCEKLAWLHVDTKAAERQLAVAADATKLAVRTADEFAALAHCVLGDTQPADAGASASRVSRLLRGWEQLVRIGAAVKAREPNLAAAADLATLLLNLTEHGLSPAVKLAERVEAIQTIAVASGVASPFTLRHAALGDLRRGNVERALERLELGIAAAQKKAEKNEELELRLTAGRILVAARSPSAKRHVDALLAEADPKAVGWGHLLSGRYELAHGNAETALQHLNEARRRIGYPPEIREGFVDAYLALDRWDAALDELAALAAEQSAPADAADEQFASAAAARDRYIALRRLQAYWGRQAWDQAAETIDALVARQPNAVAIKAVLGGLLHLAAKRPEQAVAISRSARKAQPQDFFLVLNELQVLLAAGRGAEAERLAEENARGQTDVRRLIALAEALTAGGRTEAARRFAEQANAAATGDDAKLLVRAYLGNAALGVWRRKQDRAALVEAREHYVAMLAVQPRNYLAGNNLAWLLAVDFNEPQEAVRIIEQVRGEVAAEELPPTFIDTLAVVYRRAGRSQQAVEILRNAVTRIPQQPELHFQLGLALIDEQSPDEGRRELETSLKLGLAGDAATEARSALAATTK